MISGLVRLWEFPAGGWGFLYWAKAKNRCWVAKGVGCAYDPPPPTPSLHSTLLCPVLFRKLKSADCHSSLPKLCLKFGIDWWAAPAGNRKVGGDWGLFIGQQLLFLYSYSFYWAVFLHDSSSQWDPIVLNLFSLLRSAWKRLCWMPAHLCFNAVLI